MPTQTIVWPYLKSSWYESHYVTYIKKLCKFQFVLLWTAKPRIIIFIKVLTKLSRRINLTLNTTVPHSTISLCFVNWVHFVDTAAIENNGCAKAWMVSHWLLAIGWGGVGFNASAFHVESVVENTSFGHIFHTFTIIISKTLSSRDMKVIMLLI